MTLFWRAFVVWVGLFILAFFNGALREMGLKLFVSDHVAAYISLITAIVLFTLLGLYAWPYLEITSGEQAIWVGGLWLILTVLVETFVLNRWVAGLSWKQIAQTYNLAEGQFWPVVLVWMAVLPYILWRWKEYSFLTTS